MPLWLGAQLEKKYRDNFTFSKNKKKVYSSSFYISLSLSYKIEWLSFRNLFPPEACGMVRKPVPSPSFAMDQTFDLL
jgi:hypothetical protein